MTKAADFKEHLRRQLRFLALSGASYDAGFEDEAIRIATVLRVLFHDTKASTSLLTHLGAKDRVRLISTCGSADPPDENVLLQFGFGVMEFGTGRGGLRAPLGDVAGAKLLTIAEWWDEVLFVLDAGKTWIRRRDIVLAAANKQGGAHVDPKLTPEYQRLVEDGGLGTWTRRTGEYEVSFPVENAHLVSLRQMAFEVLSSSEVLALTA